MIIFIKLYTEKKCYWINSISFEKHVPITDSNQYAIELVTYLLVLVVYFYELIVYMLLERNAIDSIAFFLSVFKNLKKKERIQFWLNSRAKVAIMTDSFKCLIKLGSFKKFQVVK